MHLSLLEEFVVFSRFLNFSKAAQRLNIAQPTLSCHIAQMEKILGFKLVVRERPLRLTPAGKRFCVDAEHILKAYNSSISLCRQISESSMTLTLARPLNINGFDKEIDRLLTVFAHAHPTVDIKWVSISDQSISEKLESGLIEAAFLSNPEITKASDGFSRDLSITPIPNVNLGPFFLWVHKDHPLAAFDFIDFNDIEECQFLLPASVSAKQLEYLVSLTAKKFNARISCVFWPGDYDDCALNASADEVILVNEDERMKPVYSIVEDRVFVKTSSFEELIKPCLISLENNENPTVAMLRDFVSSLNEDSK